ncbi:MAG: AAA family ATPase, partial [Acidimicrobiia bacterium]
MTERTAQGDDVRISMLGSFLVESRSGTFSESSFGGHKPRTLLQYLVLARDMAVSKETLAEVLWPDKPPRATAATLESYISGLRKRLFVDKDLARRALSTSPGGYRLSTDEVTVDLDLFDSLVRKAETTASLRHSLGHRIDAARLARGELLDGEPNAPWADDDRRLYQARVLKNFLMLAESQLTIGEYEEAIASASAALRVQPYAEEAFRIQMLSHYAMGHEHCARQVFDTCRNRLVADCTSVTEDLAAAIDAGEPLSLLIWSNSGRRPIVTTATGPATDRQRERRDPKLVMPFLGRVAELECLTAIVERSMQHQLTFSLVTGRYGIGKTTILERLRERFWNVSGIVSLSPTGATSRRLPLADALVGALEGRGASGAATRYCSGPYLRGDHDAFVTLSSIIRDNGPLVFLLDDLDLADTATIEALAWLRRHEPNLPLAVVMSSYPTSRFTDFGVHLSFDTMLALQPLEASDVEVLGPEGEPVRHRCGGHPLLMTDLWRWRATGADGDPPSLHELVKGQTREL